MVTGAIRLRCSGCSCCQLRGKTWWAYLIYLTAVIATGFLAFQTHSRKTRLAAQTKYVDELALIQERLNEAQRIGNIGNWDWNTQTNELWWSDEVYRLFQMEPDSFGATYEAFIERRSPG